MEIIRLLTYDGPNILGPQPGVLLQVNADRDDSRRIKTALKAGAQFIGMVLAYLEVTAAPSGAGFVLSASFTTPTPAIGAALATYVVAGIRAAVQGDAAWDRETPLLELQQRYRQEALPVPLLQLMAEARRRDLPVLTLPDGRIQFGYGGRGWVTDPTTVGAVPPWEQLGDIPIYAVTGMRERGTFVTRVATRLREAGHAPRVLDGADFAATLALLADPSTGCAVIGLESADILRRGIAFDRCTMSIVTDREGGHPPEAADLTEWTRALGLPMLVTRGSIFLNHNDPHLAALAAYVSQPVLPLAALDQFM